MISIEKILGSDSASGGVVFFLTAKKFFDTMILK